MAILDIQVFGGGPESDPKIGSIILFLVSISVPLSGYGVKITLHV